MESFDYRAPFECHGVIIHSERNGEAVGDCPFCGKEDHFYVNIQNGLWDCKLCGVSGNVSGFLSQLIEQAHTETQPGDWEKLSQNRKLPVEAFKPWGLGWDGQNWLIPARSGDGVVRTVRMWNPITKEMRSTTGCPVQLMGCDKIGTASTIWVCEGEWDFFALCWLLKMLGRPDDAVVGVPGAGTFKSDWVKFFKGKNVVLCYDNDEPGAKGEQKAAGFLTGVVKSLRFLKWNTDEPEKMDIRDLITAGLHDGRPNDTAKYQAILAKIQDRLVAESRLPVEPKEASTGYFEDKNPHALAQEILSRHYQHTGILTLRFYSGKWYLWHDGYYQPVPNDELQARVNGRLNELLRENHSNRQATKRFVVDVIEALKSQCLVEGNIKMPAWIGERPRIGKGDLLAMSNGLLDIEGVLDGEDNPLHEPTPEWFCCTHWNYPYEPEAVSLLWERFLEEVLPEEGERNLLQEFIGYSLIYNTQLQQYLILVGNGANGKSVVTQVATRILGEDNVSHVGLEKFGERFAMASTIGKLANIVSEIPDIKTVSEDILKQIVCGEMVRVEEKFIPPYDAPSTARLIFATNKVPYFRDRSNGIWRRSLILPFQVTIPEEKQDRDLVEKLCAELSDILNWAIDGLRRLRKQNGFTVPTSSKEALAEHRLASNPARSFLVETYEASSGGEIPCDAVYEAYADWCKPQNILPLRRDEFGKEIIRAFPGTERKQLRRRGGRVYCYIGLGKLTPVPLPSFTSGLKNIEDKNEGVKRKVKLILPKSGESGGGVCDPKPASVFVKKAVSGSISNTKKPVSEPASNTKSDPKPTLKIRKSGPDTRSDAKSIHEKTVLVRKIVPEAKNGKKGDLSGGLMDFINR
jgi:P4 family phage/plasmid primase-like protien